MVANILKHINFKKSLIKYWKFRESKKHIVLLNILCYLHLYTWIYVRELEIKFEDIFRWAQIVNFSKTNFFLALCPSVGLSNFQARFMKESSFIFLIFNFEIKYVCKIW